MVNSFGRLKALRAGTVLALVIGWLLVTVTGAASAATVSATGHITVYTAITGDSLAVGAGGDLWIGQTGQVTKFTTSGAVVASYPVPGDPSDLTSGPGPRIWFDEGNGTVGSISPLGSVTSYSVPRCSRPSAGPDGSVWLVCDKSTQAGRLDPQTGALRTFKLPEGTQTGLVLGPGGDMWFGDLEKAPDYGYQIGRISPDGAVLPAINLSGGGSLICTEGFSDITTGPNDTVWFDGFNDQQHCLGGAFGKVTAQGALSGYQPFQGMNVGRMTEGPGGDMWIANTETYAAIFRSSPTGSTTEFKTGNGSGTADPISGPDGRIWFLEGSTVAAISTS